MSATAGIERGGRRRGPPRGLELDIAYCNVCLGDLGSAAPHVAAAAELAERAGADGILAQALAGLTILEFLSGNGLDEARLARALSLDDPAFVGPWELRPRFVAALLLLWTMRLDEALGRVSRASRGGRSSAGDETVVPSLDLYLVLASLWAGDLRAAQTFADEALDVASLIGEPVTNALALTCGALVDAYAGRIPSARERAGAALELLFASEWMLYTTWPLAALGFAELSAGAPAAADERLRPLADLTTMMPFGNPILGIFLPDEIEAVIALGRPGPRGRVPGVDGGSEPGVAASLGGGDGRTMRRAPGRRARGPRRSARPRRSGRWRPTRRCRCRSSGPGRCW